MNARFDKEVRIKFGSKELIGDLYIPEEATAIILFSHGSGSSRFSTRNRKVAKYLQDLHFGTLLLDLLTVEEDKLYENRFNIDLLTQRLIEAGKWLEALPESKGCRIGFFGASTGAASALKAAAAMPNISAVVSRGGRPDLAKEALPLVKAPTLLIVGSLDYEVLILNRQAFSQLNCEKKLEVVTGATHLFEEKGTMEKVCELAGEWFEKYLMPATTPQ